MVALEATELSEEWECGQCNGKQPHQQIVTFEQRKQNALGKMDKSAAGQIDGKAQEICAELNRRNAYFTMSSCAGRGFLWRGVGVKSTASFARFRVTHDLIPEPAERYFDLDTLRDAEEYVEGGGGGNGAHLPVKGQAGDGKAAEGSGSSGPASCCWSGLGRLWQRSPRSSLKQRTANGDASLLPVTWLRFEPFILHVCCRDFVAATALMSAARTVFKNVGLQGWADNKLIVAIWGDEGLDMPLTTPEGLPVFGGHVQWLQGLVNDRHHRNWAKIDRFTASVQAMDDPIPSSALRGSNEFGAEIDIVSGVDVSKPKRLGPKRYDVVGDIALLHGEVPPAGKERDDIGAAILKEARQVKLVVARSSALCTDHRAPGSFETLAGRPRSPLVTTHTEFGVRYVVDVAETFFSTRMAGERQRLCETVKPGERVVIPFAGCGPEALQIAAKTDAAEICALELNPAGIKCARRSADLLQRSKPEVATRLSFLEGDARELVRQLQPRHYSRIIAPRPKAAGDGERGGAEDVAPSPESDNGAEFLRLLLPLLEDNGECHWYDFAAEWELPDLKRTCEFLSGICAEQNLACEIIRCAVANRSAIAKRQYRVVVDFRVKFSRQ